MDWADFTITNYEEHVTFLDAQIASLERQLAALKDRRGIILDGIARKKKEAH